MDPIQKTALKETAKTLAGLTAIGIAVPALVYLIPLDIIALIFGVACLIFGSKMIYDSKLARAKFDAKYKDLTQQ